ncbi:sporulation protein YpjB [Alteribacillus iranensis]|uniref:Sporulation protein YpjB n=1 Tax=Alteribacillus iranensis TaxID=930128 RepID=A0A1I1ZUS9_9BACI|nr:sporulation protein YpjB [Alteribacillus iranensis]SFE34300.1 sporulation protein YpjB [Alteribacillus iranensis]
MNDTGCSVLKSCKFVCRVLVCGGLVFMLGLGQTIAEETSETTKLNTVAEKAKVLEQLIKDGEYEEAKQIYNWMKEQWPTVNFEAHQLNVHQMAELLRAFERTSESVTSVDAAQHIRLRYATSFRLALDAAISEHHPLWKKYAEHSLTILDKVEDHLMQGQKEAALQAYQEWRRQFEVIRSAVYIGEEEGYAPFASYLSYLDNHSKWIEKEDPQDIKELRKKVTQLINGDYEKSNVDPSLWLVIITIGSVIVSSLTYTGWKKYKGEKSRQQLRD